MFEKRREKIPFDLSGILLEVGELVHVVRKDIPDLRKRVLVVETKDGQLFYPEVRNKRLEDFEVSGIRPGNSIKVSCILQGSEKSGKRYNNIFISEIVKE